MHNRIIGVDFDNTIADYDGLMHRLALKAQWIHEGINPHKQSIRDHIRSLSEGEIKWQKLQAMVYGKFMAQATLIDGVADFFETCRQQNVPVFIVSHKTQFAAQDEERIDLHHAALAWLKEKKFKEPQVFFEPTRQKKIERIITLGCTHFIDDLVETFQEKSFPEKVQKILYAPHEFNGEHRDIAVKTSWEGIYECFFANIRK